MPTPRAGYYTEDGKRVPGTTTICGRFKECGGLIHWAWSLGAEGIDYREARDTAADIGTSIHQAIDDFVHAQQDGAEGYEVPTVEPVVKALQGFIRWWQGQRFTKVVATEVQMVSEAHRFGGTPDAFVEDEDGRLHLLDYKSGNDVYVEALMQVAAYEKLWEEVHPEQPVTGDLHIIRFSKEHGDFVHRSYAELDLAWQQFLLFRAAYENDKALKKRAK